MCMYEANILLKSALKFHENLFYERPEGKAILLLPILY